MANYWRIHRIRIHNSDNTACFKSTYSVVNVSNVRAHFYLTVEIFHAR